MELKNIVKMMFNKYENVEIYSMEIRKVIYKGTANLIPDDILEMKLAGLSARDGYLSYVVD